MEKLFTKSGSLKLINRKYTENYAFTLLRFADNPNFSLSAYSD